MKLHRIRQTLRSRFNAAIDSLRAVGREFGFVVPVGANGLRPAGMAAFPDHDDILPMRWQPTLDELLDGLASKLMRRLRAMELNASFESGEGGNRDVGSDTATRP